MSESGPDVYRAIAACMADLSKIGVSKEGTNQQQGYKFRGIDQVLNALSPVLAKHGLVIVPRMLHRESTERATAKGGVLFYVVVTAEFDFVAASDGSHHAVRIFGEAMDSADKATNKAMSAAYKYAAFQTFCIPTEAEDADATTHELAPAMHQAAPSRRHSEPEPVPAEHFGMIEGAVYVERIDVKPTKNPNITKYTVHLSDGRAASTIRDQIAKLAKTLQTERTPVAAKTSEGRFGTDLLELTADEAFQGPDTPIDLKDLPF